MNFKDKTILITGAASGIGRAAALAFAKAGGIIIVSDINEKGGIETATQIKATGKNALFVKTNVADFSSVEKLMQRIVDQFGRLDIAVIVQQIYYRYHNGLTTNEKFANLNQSARLFIEVAWQAIQQKRIENLF